MSLRVYPSAATIAACFEAQVDATPAAIAVAADDHRLTYEALDLRANRLAHRLRALGVGPDQLVGVCMDRCAELVVSLLAILKAGGAFVPLEPGYPKDRLAFMVEDTAPRVVLTTVALQANLPLEHLGDAAVLVVDDPAQRAAIGAAPASRPSAQTTATNLAYVMYTSGSTGRPKGVCVMHRNVIRLVKGADYASFEAGDRVLLAAPIAFDASTLELWGPLLNGGELHVYPAGAGDIGDLCRFVEDREITTLWLTSALFHQVVDHHLERLHGVRQLLAGGDVLSGLRCRKVLDTLPDCTLINGYGPTENTTFTCCHRMDHPGAVESPVPIGRAIAGTTVYILDQHQQPVPDGEIGELYTGGDGVARGYLDRPELTAERFLADPFSDAPGATMYRTGDLARRRPDQIIEFHGRADRQLKIRGFRVEPGEIEAALLVHPAVQDVVVGPFDAGGTKRLAAWIVPKAGASAPDAAATRAFLAATLPEHLLPARVATLVAMPLTPTGKVDRLALPTPAATRPDLGAPPVAPSTELEAKLVALWVDILGVAPVGTRDRFFDLGGDSLSALTFVGNLERTHGLKLPIMRLFESPTIEALARTLTGGPNESAASRRTRAHAQRLRQLPSGGDIADGIAIIGMAARLPGAANVRELWQLLIEGRETTCFFRPDELDPDIDPAEAGAPDYVRARGIIEDGDAFDAGFFGFSPRMAQVMDPQQRVFLEVAWQALEDAGYETERYEGLIGIWGGKVYDSYQANYVAHRPDVIEQVGALNVRIANEKDYVPIHVAHKLDLTGPAISVHTACSTSLVATVQACFALAQRQCDIALAGGVSISAPIRQGHRYVEGSMLSKDGHTRPFDADATGTVFSDGAGIVVLKRLDDALTDGDTIHAVIRGAAINNDGAHRASFSAPNVDGQAAVIRMALARARWSADDIGYVEAHGTATPLGDPIEVEALTRAFRDTSARRGYCAIGSIKSNFGHATAAAGVAGLIKATLAAEHGLIPPSLGYQEPNPRIDFESSPFFVNDQLRQWPGQRRAGVSSFGVGGTNAHVVLEAWTSPPPDRVTRPSQLLVLSARSPAAVDEAADRLREHLEATPQIELADAAFTLKVGRRAFGHRRFVVAKDAAEAIARLGEAPPATAGNGVAPQHEPELVFMFPGQGAQYLGMGRALYDEEPVFRQAMDACAAALEASDVDLLPLLYPGPGADEAAATAALMQTEHTQPAMFAIEYALARLWQSWGLVPSAMVGHSLGEITAACLAGVMSLDDAATLVAERGRLMQARPAGSMLMVRLPPEEVEATLPDGLELACANAPQLSVVAGPTDRIEAYAKALQADGSSARVLRTSHAFHTRSMDAVVEPLRACLARMTLLPPRVPIASTATGSWLTDAEATDPAYWARHARVAVRFKDAISTLLSDERDRVFVEVGPRRTVAAFAAQSMPRGGGSKALATLDVDAVAGDEYAAILSAMGRLWLAGVEPSWPAFYAPEERRRIALPTYPFERTRYWLERPKTTATQLAQPPAATADVEALITKQLDIIARQMKVIRGN